MKRYFFNLLAAVSLVMALAVAALWARGVWWHSDSLAIYTDSSHFYLHSDGGFITVNRGNYAVGLRKDTWHSGVARPTVWWPPFICTRVDWPADSTSELHFIIIADWLLILILAVLPGAWLTMRDRARKSPGCCTQCGYDLRGTAPDKACPECGAAIPAGNSN